MTEAIDRSLVSVRTILRIPERGVTSYARTHSFSIGKPISFDIAEPEPTGAEYFLGALASDLLGLLRSIAKRRRIVIDDAEANIQAELVGTLAYLGVIGANGEPHFSRISISIYVGSSGSEDELQEIWREAVSLAPLFNTLRRAIPVDVSLQRF